MIRTCIGIGSNLGDRLGHIQLANLELQHLPSTELLAFSSIYETDPIGPIPQGAYLNAVALLETHLTPLDLWTVLTDIEQHAGRPPLQRRIPWEPRTLDLDILLYDQLVTSTPTLTIPHPRMHDRWFVLKPLCDIAPETIHPTIRKSARELLETIPVAAGVQINLAPSKPIPQTA
jgi:2-amino-4-hydroxy-6-hydroxymethyldihydropteridine diphosphokinase